jgi:hypothetical protein
LQEILAREKERQNQYMEAEIKRKQEEEGLFQFDE